MIIDEKVKDVVVDGEDTSKKARISENKMAKLQYLLTKGLYKDPITAVIAEWTNNGVDSIVQAGKDPIENPVIVKIEKRGDGQYYFSVEDKGTGLDDRDFEDICMNYLESTKEGNNDTIGHFGIGMKSFLSLDRSATFTCRKNGKERKYLVYEGAEFVNFDLLYCKDTDEENGVLAELNVTSGEQWTFQNRAKMKLAYYDTAVLVIHGKVQENSIYRNDLFQYSSNADTRDMHLTLKDVYYPIDWSALGISSIPISIAIRLGLGDGLVPTPSREAYITNEKIKKMLLGKIREIADWFMDRYNEMVKEFPDFKTAYEHLGIVQHHVKVGDSSFHIDPLKQYSTKQFAIPKIKGVTVEHGNYYRSISHNIFYEYTPVAYTNSRSEMVTQRRVPSIHSRALESYGDGSDVVLVNTTPVGNIREYLKVKYGEGTLFVKRNGNKRILGSKKDIQGGQCYFTVLGLATKKKSSWRERISEFDFVVKSIVSTFKDETGIESDKDFLAFVEKRKKDLRDARGKNPTTYKGLNKQDGDVTMAWAYKGLRGTAFRKEAVKVSSLKNRKVLTVIITEDDDLDLVRKVYDVGVLKNVRFALVGKKEMKKIPNHYQFINWKKFMSRDCKPFMRMASAFLFEEVIDRYNEIGKFGNDTFKKIFKRLHDDKEQLRRYKEDNLKYVGAEVKGAIMDVAAEHDLFDKSLWEEYTRVKEDVKKYDFITLFKDPYYGSEEEKKRYERAINQMLLFRKKYYDDLPKGAKIVFE